MALQLHFHAIGDFNAQGVVAHFADLAEQTTGGMVGKISQLGDHQIGLDVGNGVTVQLQRHAVVQVLPKGTV